MFVSYDGPIPELEINSDQGQENFIANSSDKIHGSSWVLQIIAVTSFASNCEKHLYELELECRLEKPIEEPGQMTLARSTETSSHHGLPKPRLASL